MTPPLCHSPGHDNCTTPVAAFLVPGAGKARCRRGSNHCVQQDSTPPQRAPASRLGPPSPPLLATCHQPLLLEWRRHGTSSAAPSPSCPARWWPPPPTTQRPVAASRVAFVDDKLAGQGVGHRARVLLAGPECWHCHLSVTFVDEPRALLEALLCVSRVVAPVERSRSCCWRWSCMEAGNGCAGYRLLEAGCWPGG